MACIAGGWRLHSQSHQFQDVSYLQVEKEQSESPHLLRVFVSFLLGFDKPAAAWQFMGHGRSLAGHQRAPVAKSRGASYLSEIDDFFGYTVNKTDTVPDYVPSVVPDFVPKEEQIEEEFQPDDTILAFLLQRTVQSRCYRLRKMRGDFFQESNWLSRQTKVPVEMHGITSTTSKDWVRWLKTMLNTPHLTLPVEDLRGTYEIGLDPPEVASRIMSEAEGIADAMIGELEKIHRTDNFFWDKWAGEVATDDEDAQLRAAMRSLPKDDSWDDITSPAKMANADLLEALSTKEAVIQTLTALQMEKEEELYRLLLDFVREDSNGSAFSGNLKYRVSEDFLFKLLRKPWRMSGERMVEPRSVVERVLERRRELALEWIGSLKNAPQIFASVKRANLEQKFKEE